MNLSHFKPFHQYSFYEDSIYNQIFENVKPVVKRDPTVILKQILKAVTKKHLLSQTFLKRKLVRYLFACVL